MIQLPSGCIPMISEWACWAIWRISVRRYASGIQSRGSIFWSAARMAANCSGPPSPPPSTLRSAAVSSACSASATWSRRLSGTPKSLPYTRAIVTPRRRHGQYAVTSPGRRHRGLDPLTSGSPVTHCASRTSVPTVSPTVERTPPARYDVAVRRHLVPRTAATTWSRAAARRRRRPLGHGPKRSTQRQPPAYPRDSRAYPQAPYPGRPIRPYRSSPRHRWPVPDPSQAETALIEIFGPHEAFGPPPEEMPDTRARRRAHADDAAVPQGSQPCPRAARAQVDGVLPDHRARIASAPGSGSCPAHRSTRRQSRRVRSQPRCRSTSRR